MALGEAQSKCLNIAGVPLRPQTAQHLYEIYLAKGVHATTAIEGNSLSEEEVLKRVQKKGVEQPPSREYLDREIQNIINICNSLKNSIGRSDFEVLSRVQIEGFNQKILEGLPLPDEVTPGKVRRHSVLVGSYRGAPAEDCELLLDKLCTWLNEGFNSPTEKNKIAYGIIKAIVSHVYLAWIHPFGDGNGRTARIVEFYVLMSCGVPAPACQLLSNHYNQTRTEYYRQIAKTSAQGCGDLIPFIEYAVQGFIDGLLEQLKWIGHQHLMVTWENFVYSMFHGKTGTTAERQRNLVLELTSQNDPVPIGKIPEISPRSARAYATKTTKTIRRDINSILGMDPPLIVSTPQGYVANVGIVSAFLPSRVAAGREGISRPRP
jgi:Fic family protein